MTMIVTSQLIKLELMVLLLGDGFCGSEDGGLGCCNSVIVITNDLVDCD